MDILNKYYAITKLDYYYYFYYSIKIKKGNFVPSNKKGISGLLLNLYIYRLVFRGLESDL